jgi:hypothetical protein
MGASHESGPLYIASGVYIRGSLRATGGIATGSVQAKSLATGSNGPVFSSMLGRPSVTTHTVASGTIVEGWVFVPHRNITVREIGMHFGTGPQGGLFTLKLHSISSVGTLTSKGLASGVSVAGGAKKVVRFTGLTATFPAGNAVGIAVKTVGGTVAGRGGKPTIHYTYR